MTLNLRDFFDTATLGLYDKLVPSGAGEVSKAKTSPSGILIAAPPVASKPGFLSSIFTGTGNLIGGFAGGIIKPIAMPLILLGVIAIVLYVIVKKETA